MKNLFLILFLFSLGLTTQKANAQNPAAFQIYNQKGKKVKVNAFLKALENNDIILFGELHDNPISHWLQLKTAQHLYGKSPISMGAEMLETHQQEALDQYLKGEITQAGLDSLTTLWPNYKTDYKPLVDFSKKNQIPFVATNIPREYASYVYRNGLEALENYLDSVTKREVAPLPIAYDPNLSNYKAMSDMMAHAPNPNLPKAQAIKDATMAYFILQHIKEHPELFLHFNGDYHSKNYEGIYWYLKNADDNLKIITISTVEQGNVHQLEEAYKGQADFILVVDSEMTKTH